MKQYKILTQRDPAFSGNPFKAFTPETIEKTLNTLASEGWTVVKVFTTGIWMPGHADEPVLLLERDAPAVCKE